MKLLKKYSKELVFHTIFGYSLYFTAFVYFDTLALIPILALNSVSLNFFANSNTAGEPLQYSKNEKKRAKYILLTLVVFELFVSYILRSFYPDVFSWGSLEIFGIELCGSFVVYIELLVIFLYIHKIHREEKIFVMNRRIFRFCLLMILPFLIYDFTSLNKHVMANPLQIVKTHYFEDFFRAFILAGLVEELLYRVLLYDELKKIFSKRTATLLQALFFMMIHSQRWILLFTEFDLYVLLNLIVVFILAVVSAHLRERTNSIIPSVILHGSLNNGVYSLWVFLYKILVF